VNKNWFVEADKEAWLEKHKGHSIKKATTNEEKIVNIPNHTIFICTDCHHYLIDGEV